MSAGRALRLLPLVLPLWLLASGARAAEVRNVAPSQDGSRVLFEYNLEGTEAEAEIEVTLTIDGKKYTARDLHLQGDVGKVSVGAGKRIYWNVLEDFPGGILNAFDWEIRAKNAEARTARTAVEEPPPAVKIAAKLIRVEVVDRTAGKLPPGAADQIADEIATQTAELRTGIGAKVVKGRNARADAILRISVDEFDAGSATRRIVSLGLGAGKARLRYKVELIDAGTMDVKRTVEYDSKSPNPFRGGKNMESRMAGRIGAECANFLSTTVK